MKLKSVTLNLTSQQCYLMACLLTGQQKNSKTDKERKVCHRNISSLVNKIDPPYFGAYYEVVDKIDWSKAEKNKRELQKLFTKIATKISKKSSPRGLGLLMDWAKMLEKKI